MSELAVTVIGHDRPGIVAGVTAVLAELGANIEDSSMTRLRGNFAMTLVVSLDTEAARVEEALLPVVGRLGLHVTVTPVTDEQLEPAGAHYVLTVHGADRPGIVAAVAELLADCAGNITDLTTRLTGSLYVLVCEVDLPDSVDVAELTGQLATLGEQLGVHVALHAAEADVL